MNEILTERVPMAAISGNVNPIILDLKQPTGWVARLYDFSVYLAFGDDGRYGINLYVTPIPARTAVRVWTTDAEVLDDSGSIVQLKFENDIATSGQTLAFFPHTEHLWDLDYRVVTPVRIGGFVQVNQLIGFRLRYKLMRASNNEIAAIMNWQNSEQMLGQVV